MIDDDDVKLLLGGKPEEQERGIAALCDQFSKPLWSFVLKRFPGLSHADVGEIVDDTFLAVWKAIQKGAFDLNKPLSAFLFTVAMRSAVDVLRKHKARVDGTTDDDIAVVADRIAGSEAAMLWRQISVRERAHAVQAEFNVFLRSLPPVQRQVAQVMADNFPDELGQEATADEIYKRTGERPTVASIKRARAMIRQKFKDYLKANII